MNINTHIYPVLKRSLYFFTLLILFSCSSNKNTTKPGGKNSSSPLVVDLKLFHEDSKNSKLFFKIDGTSIIYLRKSENDYFLSNIDIHYRVLSTDNYILDSNTIYIKSQKEKSSTQNDLLGEIPLKIDKKEFKIQLFIKDHFKKKSAFNVELKANKNRFSENIILRNQKDNSIIFNSVINNEMDVKIESSKNISIEIKQFTNSNKISPPPFSSSSPSEGIADVDTSFYIETNSSSIALSKKGVYQLSPVLGEFIGKSKLVYLSNDFPEINSTSGMHESIRFITTKDEYDKIENSSNQKLAIDKFWLSISNANKDRAKALIREYYNRVHLANKYYTSYKEGWKTDRGMLAIIFGFPRNIFEGNGSQTWVYGDPSSMSSLTFTFKEMANPFGVKEYELIRYKSYKDFWNRAVSSWRKGRIFNY